MNATSSPNHPDCPGFRSLILLVGLLFLVAGFSGCAGFRRLGKDLKFIDETSIVSAQVTNAGSFRNVYGLAIEWDREADKVLSADFTKVGELGVFGFFVEGMDNQYLMAFSDSNGNEKYDSSDPAWIHSDSAGNPVPIAVDPTTRKGRSDGRLSSSTKLPTGLVQAAREFKGERSTEEAASGWSIPIALGDIADPGDPRFSSEQGEKGLWEPASFPMESGIGIYFMQKYDPNKIPVLFVYGAAGSPQDWKTFGKKIDRRKYQPWFYYYPTGRRLDEMATALNNGIELLQAHYGFQRLHVVAHSMGGLVSRSFIIKNVIEDGNGYITRFVSISTPWQGHKFAGMGVKWSPAVVPSWRDMQTDSRFQRQIFSYKLKGKVDHLLLYGHLPKGSQPLEKQTDGTVSVKSETNPPAVKDAVKVKGYEADHVGILSRDDVIKEVFQFLGQ